MDLNSLIDELVCQTNIKSSNLFESKKCKDNIFIHFWATWCGPCVMELPELQKIYNEYNQKIDFLFVSCDTSKLDIDAFLFNKGLSIPVGYDFDNTISRKFNVRSIPSSFYIKRLQNANYEVKNIVGSMNYSLLKDNFDKFYKL